MGAVANYLACVVAQFHALRDSVTDDHRNPPGDNQDGWAIRRTYDLVAKLRPRVGDGPADKLFAAALVEAKIKQMLPTIHPVLCRVKAAHDSFVQAAFTAAGDCKQLDGDLIGQFSKAVDELRLLLPALEDEHPQVPVADGPAVVPHAVEWNQAKVNTAVVLYFERHDELYRDALAGKATAKKTAKRVFGRDRIALEIHKAEGGTGEGPQTLVGKSSWRSKYYAIFPDKTRVKGQSKMGFDRAIDERSEETHEPAETGLEREEAIRKVQETRLFRALNGRDQEHYIRNIQDGVVPLEKVWEMIEQDDKVPALVIK